MDLVRQLLDDGTIRELTDAEAVDGLVAAGYDRMYARGMVAWSHGKVMRDVEMDPDRSAGG